MSPVAPAAAGAPAGAPAPLKDLRPAKLALCALRAEAQ